MLKCSAGSSQALMNHTELFRVKESFSAAERVNLKLAAALSLGDVRRIEK